jgi:hypothetical protein
VIHPTVTPVRLGFLTVVEMPDLGYCGGLLVLSANGRPLQFHCTSPTSPNRAQQILYGKTLREFLFCEQIGLALWEKIGGEKTTAVIIDVPELQSLSNLIDVPLVLLANQAETTDENGDGSSDPGRPAHIISGNEVKNLELILQEFKQQVALDEPFERIRQAINEAHAVAC